MHRNAWMIVAAGWLAASGAQAQDTVPLAPPVVEPQIAPSEGEVQTDKAADAPAPAMTVEEALFDAIRRNDDARVRMLMRAQSVDISQPNAQGEYPLLLAVTHASLDIVKMITGAGADVMVTDTQGRNALHIAAAQGDLDKVKLMIALHLPAEQPDREGMTALYHAYSAGNTLIPDYLIEKEGAKVNRLDTKGEPLAFRAIGARDNEEVAKHLIAHKVSLFRKNTAGQTLHEYAQRLGHSRSAKLLQEAYDAAVKAHQEKLKQQTPATESPTYE